MRVVQIAGFLGSGKTSILLEVASKISQSYKKRVAMVVNEIGDVPVDAKVIEVAGMKVKEIAGGCICCELGPSLAASLVDLADYFKPDLVLIEPTGVAIPDQVKVAIGMSTRDTDAEIVIGPVIVLYDAFRVDELLQNETVNNFIMRQVLNADVVAISKVDLVDEDRIQYCDRMIRGINSRALIIRLSTVRGDGMDELIKILLEPGGTPIGGRVS